MSMRWLCEIWHAEILKLDGQVAIYSWNFGNKNEWNVIVFESMSYVK